MFAMHISDSTGSILVQVCFDDAQKFLCNTPVDRIVSKKSTLQVLMDQLLTPEVWMDCLIKSFTVENEKHYQLFGTTLKVVR
jgi:hypothetical protein